MQYAVNYSKSASELLKAKRISIDCWKLFENEELLNEASKSCPVRVHFSFQAGSGDAFDKERICRTEKFLAGSETYYVNTHLVPINGAQCAEYIDLAGRDIAELCRIFGHEKVIAENIFPQDANQHPACDAAVISEIIRSFNIGLLFDVGHAKIAASLRGERLKSYIKKLPLERVCEMHVSGVKKDPSGNAVTDHYPMSGDDYLLLSWLCDQIRVGVIKAPSMVAVECGGVGGILEGRVGISDLARDIPRVHSILHNSVERQAA